LSNSSSVIFIRVSYFYSSTTQVSKACFYNRFPLPIKTETMNSVLSAADRSQLEAQGFPALAGND
jgi:hypothetical protein